MNTRKFFELRDTDYVLVAIDGERLGDKDVDTFITAITQKSWFAYLALNNTGKDYKIHVSGQEIDVLRSLTNDKPVGLLDIITPILHEDGKLVKGNLTHLNRVATNICYNSSKFFRSKLLKEIDDYAVGYTKDYYLFK